MHLILDSEVACALEDNCALGLLPPPRATVPPVLYEVTELELLRELLLSRRKDPKPPLAAA